MYNRWFPVDAIDEWVTSGEADSRKKKYKSL